MDPTRILFISSKAAGINADTEEDAIQKIFRNEKAFEFHSCHATTKDDILHELMCKPHIVHFSCHGTASEGIYIQEEGTNGTLESSEIWALLKPYCNDLRCVVFNSCYSSELARDLHDEGIPCVIGMEGIVETNYAINFAKHFYESLFHSDQSKNSYFHAFNVAKSSSDNDKPSSEVVGDHATAFVGMDPRNSPIIFPRRFIPFSMPNNSLILWIMAAILAVGVIFACIYPYLPAILHSLIDVPPTSDLITRISNGDEKARKEAEKGLKMGDTKLQEDLEKSASGDMHAQNILGAYAYQVQNYPEALKWYGMSAEQGDAEGQAGLGNCYYHGYGVEADKDEAFRLYGLSEAQGNAEGQAGLGNCYYHGYGVKADKEEAFRLYGLSEAQGNAEGQAGLGNCYYYGHGVGTNFKKAFDLYTLSASQDNAEGQNGLGNCYYNGHGVKQDYEKAFQYFQKSAEQGNSSGQNGLGRCYEKGQGYGGKADLAQAKYWYGLAAAQGDENAQDRLSKLK